MDSQPSWVLNMYRLKRETCSSLTGDCVLPSLGLVHVGDELREVNGVSIIHKKPDEISQLLVG
jgi:hypothetical protein